MRRISGQERNEKVNVGELLEFTDTEQVEKIADRFEAVSNRYDPLKDDDVDLPSFTKENVPEFSTESVRLAILSLKSSSATVPGDIPARVLKMFAGQIAIPLAHVINCSIASGVYPNLWKSAVCDQSFYSGPVSKFWAYAFALSKVCSRNIIM